ncbi:Nif3-like dinuclear metal center hexameric protein [candidate division KSB1 bacterium 4484_87]|nr:MAG: Nif3-like dinuclear metal center hexameric protein [candidate division KSB1 bacterium 4484_87]
MVDRDTLEKFLADFLKVEDFEDYCINGIQVEGGQKIQKIVLGVSVSQRLFREAAQRGADAIIVHHGLFWKNDPTPFSLRGLLRDRVATLLKNDISLFGYHLPLDAHPEIGNNAMILQILGLTQRDAVDVGFMGTFPKPISRENLLFLVNENLETKAQLFPFGKEQIKSVAVISGASSSDYPLVATSGADAFIAGEIKENHVREIEEVGMNFISAGHYNTERFGVQALGDYISQHFDVHCEYVDVPNPV